MSDDDVPSIPLDGILDLHSFHPHDVADVVREYARACQLAGVLQLRIIHGKGRGVQRDTVIAVLDAMPTLVARHRVAEPERGGWGARIVDLHLPGR
jgi:dsDNA-specific endonuclease/ATPase MutS2